jgi:superfamily I DNA/RNA helicase
VFQMNGRNRHTEVLYGPPGTGKTTALLRIVEEALEAGIPGNQIAYLAFTVKAAREAIERATAKFNLQASSFPHFRTIHSLAFRYLGLSSSQVLKRKHLSSICERLGYEFSGYIDLEDGQTSTALLGDRLLFIEGLAKSRRISYEEQFARTSEDCSFHEFILLTEGLAQFKQAHFLIDFNDMLERFIEVEPPQFEVLIIDEAQDLSNLQWEAVHGLIRKAKRAYLAGDDDQAIFKWAGANPDRLVALGREGLSRTLEQSFRVPEAVHRLGTGVITGISNRPAKLYRPRQAEGLVDHATQLTDLDLDRGDWLILARNTYLLKEAQNLCMRDGLGYMGKGGKIFVPEGVGDPDFRPNVRISTIHGSKGTEADNVALFSDMSAKTYSAMQDNLDDELRTFYVAITRARESLFIIDPKTSNYGEFLYT